MAPSTAASPKGPRPPPLPSSSISPSISSGQISSGGPTPPRLSITGPTLRDAMALSLNTEDSQLGTGSNSHSRQPVPFPITRSFSISSSSSSAPASHAANPAPATSTDDAESSSIRRQRPVSISRSPSPSPSPSRDTPLPIEPIPDSLLCRSTFASLEHNAGTLKRLTKSVLSSTATVLSLLEQVEKAEDDMMSTLGELGRWLEAGYGVSSGVWSDGGVRKVKKEARVKEREDIEVMVEHSLRAVKSEIKRQGLAGAGAQARFEQTAKQYYQQTASYLSPNPSGGNPNLSSPSSSGLALVSAQAANDLAQAARTAQFDLARYNHHSTLLYAVPPSSVGCLDLLVGLYGWSGGQLGETPQLPDGSAGDDESAALRRSVTGVDGLKRSLSLALAQLAQKRSTLLASWGERDAQTTALERDVTRRHSEAEQPDNRALTPTMTNMARDSSTSSAGGGSNVVPESPLNESPMNSLAVSSAGIEHRVPRKMHKLHRSVGGRLRDLLSSSASSTSLAAMADKGTGRKSFDGGSAPGAGVSRSSYSAPSQSASAPPVLPQLIESPDSPAFSNDSQLGSPFETTMNPIFASLPLPSSTAVPTNSTPSDPLPTGSGLNADAGEKRRKANRHSLLLPLGEETYNAPFISSAGSEDYVVVDSPTQATSTDARAAIAATTAKLTGAGGGMGIGGVGGINGDGDEDEQREQVGRKKEGVLWGAGSWEGLDKGAGKGKWERFWVVLAHCRIYEYRDSGLGRPETAHAVIDLKFASVREGRGTDRRFVFEIVTPTQGRRLYQATSESEMKTWVYAICNAIESSINGTSTVRTFDTSKLRTASGALDDHALPARTKLGIGFHSRGMGGIGIGLPLPSQISSGMGAGNNRRSMPPPSRETGIGGGGGGGGDEGGKRARKTSFKNRLKQSAEAAGGRWSSVVNNVSGQRNSVNAALEVPRPSFLAAAGRMPSYTATSTGGITNVIPPGSLSATASTSGLSADGRTTPLSIPVSVPMSDVSPSSSRTRPSDRMSWYEESVDGDIEKRVMEMAGLGLGSGSGSGTNINGSGSGGLSASQRRVTSEVIKTPTPNDFKFAGGEGGQSAKMARSRSADAEQPFSLSATGGVGEAGSIDGHGIGQEVEEEQELDPTKRLKRIVQLPGNDKCADCGKSMRSSRWATLSLRDQPMVMFICIRCCGLHRGLGTHISKPRSVDLDIWSPESIALAQRWGNEKGNAVWERLKPSSTPLPTDEDIATYIRAKYVEGRWLAPEDRVKFGLDDVISGTGAGSSRRSSVLIGRAI